MDTRLNALELWLHTVLPEQELNVAPLSGDASFRRYFRVKSPARTWVAMDAPPEKEDCHPFCAIADQWHQCGIPVPVVEARDFSQGFLLLSDFGDDLMLGQLDSNSVDMLYRTAIEQLIPIQRCAEPPQHPLPPYDRALLSREMALFRDWLVGQRMGLELSPNEHRILDQFFEALIQNALEQPQVNVHRDYHSRNLLVTHNQGLAVLDFQDAVRGPYTYDLVSLLRDCYIQWPPEQVQRWALYYHELAEDAGIADAAPEVFLRWFDLMGIQRHLKAAGIFARLFIRDGKAGYLKDIPRTVGYINSVLARYPEFAEFHSWLQVRVLPALDEVVAHEVRR